MAITSDQDVNWKITQGDDFLCDIEYKDPDDNPINISDFTILLEVKDKPGGKILSARCTIGDGIEITDGPNGKFSISISGAKTNVFNYPRASYQIQGTTSSNEKITLLQGWFIVNAGTIG
jgi:hypothetical protein